MPVGVDAVGELGAGGEQFGEPLVEIGLGDGDQDRLGGAGREVARAAAGTARGERREQRVAQSGVQGGFDRRIGGPAPRRAPGRVGRRRRRSAGGSVGGRRRGVGASRCRHGAVSGVTVAVSESTAGVGCRRRRSACGVGWLVGASGSAVRGRRSAAAACSGVRMPAATARSTSSVRIGCQVASGGEFAGEVGVDGAVPGQVRRLGAQPEQARASTVICTSGVRRDGGGGVGGAVAAPAGAGEVVLAVHEREVGVHEAMLGVAGVVGADGGGDLGDALPHRGGLVRGQVGLDAVGGAAVAAPHPPLPRRGVLAQLGVFVGGGADQQVLEFGGEPGGGAAVGERERGGLRPWRSRCR